MTFTVTYRAKDGALREERIEVANRAACVAVCRQRGIAPTKIAEGRSGRSAASPKGANGQDARSLSQRAGRPLSQWLVAALIVVAAGCGVWWWIGGRGAAAPAAEKPTKPKVEKPKAAKPKTASV